MKTNGIVNVLNLRSGKELRAHPRIQVMMDAELYSPEDFTKFVPGFIIDISLGGVGLKTSKTIFKLGEEVDFHFTFSSGNKLILTSRVVNASEYLGKMRYGFQYFNLVEENEEKLKKFLYSLII